jgi:hypothetical protein
MDGPFRVERAVQSGILEGCAVMKRAVRYPIRRVDMGIDMHEPDRRRAPSAPRIG